MRIINAKLKLRSDTHTDCTRRRWEKKHTFATRLRTMKIQWQRARSITAAIVQIQHIPGFCNWVCGRQWSSREPKRRTQAVEEEAPGLSGLSSFFKRFSIYDRGRCDTSNHSEGDMPRRFARCRKASGTGALGRALAARSMAPLSAGAAAYAWCKVW
jgi:hypothetical protein